MCSIQRTDDNSRSSSVANHLVKPQSEEANENEESELSNKQRLDLLDILLAAKDSDGRGLTFREIRDEVDTFLFAGLFTVPCTQLAYSIIVFVY